MYQKFFPKNVHNFTQVFVFLHQFGVVIGVVNLHASSSGFLHQFGVVIGVVNLHASSSGLPACTTLNLQAMKINNTIIDIITVYRYNECEGR